jgi:CRISPR-associated protein Cmr5
VSRQTLAQRRAAHALVCVKEHARKGKESYGNYVSYVEALPATIVMNGLGQACATLLSKAGPDKNDGKLVNRKDPHFLLYADLQAWLCGGEPAAPYPHTLDKGDDCLMQGICGGNQRKYVHAQAEALAYLIWLKKLASAFLERGTEE